MPMEPSTLGLSPAKLLIFLTLAILSAISSCQGARWQDPAAFVNVTREASAAGHHVLRSEAFSRLNRRRLVSCGDWNPYLAMEVDATGSLADVQNVTVTVSGVLDPNDLDWIAAVSPSTSNADACPTNLAMYLETGDTSSQPLLGHYPVKYQFLRSDPQYTACGKPTCQQAVAGVCLLQTCSGAVSFRLINIRTDVSFVFFTGGLDAPCVLKASTALPFANPKSPLYGHLASVDSTATKGRLPSSLCFGASASMAVAKMRLTWVSGDGAPQQVNYNGISAISSVSTFTAAQMCSQVPSPATDFGWHDPGYIHTAVMTGLTPSTAYSYSYGSASAGWSKSTIFTTPPAAGASSVRVVMYGDMGKAERDNACEHFVQPGSIGVIDALVARKDDVDVVFHIGDISYATGFMVEWDSFLELIAPVASKVSYMTAIGNHERDFPDSGSVYKTTDSGGECGVPYETYFPMPTPATDRPWYSFGSGPVHFTVMSTEHDWARGSEQYGWLQADLAAVDRAITPWIIFAGHRPAYSSYETALNLILPAVDSSFPPEIEPLLLAAKVDFAVWGHVHNYERTCAVFQSTCLGSPTKDSAGVDTYNNANYTAPVHAVIGMAGFSLDNTALHPPAWSLVRILDFGYSYVQADSHRLLVQFVSSTSGAIADQFAFTR